MRSIVQRLGATNRSSRPLAARVESHPTPSTRRGTDCAQFYSSPYSALALLLPFLALGNRLDLLLGGQELAALFARAGGWARPLPGAAGGRSRLPVPATGVMAALGVAYGPVAGGLLGATGSFIAGAWGYLACRSLSGRSLARLLGPSDLERGAPAVLRRWRVAGRGVACAALAARDRRRRRPAWCACRRGGSSRPWPAAPCPRASPSRRSGISAAIGRSRCCWRPP